MHCAGEKKVYLGSSCLVAPRPYSGITLSLLIAALHTGHIFLAGRVSNHWCKQGQLYTRLSYVTLHYATDIYHSSKIISPKQMAAHADNCILCCIKANVTFKGSSILLLFVSRGVPRFRGSSLLPCGAHDGQLS